MDLHLEDLGAVAPAVAGFARHPEVREEEHLDLGNAGALARLAPTPFHVEREGPRRVAALSGERHAGVALPDAVEGLHVGRWVGAARPRHRALVDERHFVELAEAARDLVRPRRRG